MWRLIYAIPSWLIFVFIIELPLIILGWLLVPIAVLCKAYSATGRKEDPTRLIFHFDWKFMWLWDNYEDGILAGKQYKDYGKAWKQIIYWSCLRNPVNNLRITPYLSCNIDPTRVQFYGSFGSLIYNKKYESRDFSAKTNGVDTKSRIEKYDTKIPQWFFAWQNWFHSNFYWQFLFKKTLYRFWVGTSKIFPTDIYGVTEYRRLGAGPVLQFKRVKL